ncbi:MAG: tetratricopeptide repeat protein [Candidatus Lindowbacteria bacterium]|nr:tetratricopeptide repeat protein [Candidatus Lindowbacteria bacterium]
MSEDKVRDNINSTSLISISKKNAHFLAVFCLVYLVFAIFWQVRSFDFIAFDDNLYVYGNPFIQDGFNAKSIKWAFEADFLFDTKHADYWQPITFLSRIMDIELFGLNAGAHHLVNVLIHLTNSILLYLFFVKTTSAWKSSAFVAAIFAAHPLQVESVAWVVERKDVLATFFWLATMLSYSHYVKKKEKRWYLLSIGLFALGIMSKPLILPLSVILLALDYWPLNRFDLKKSSFPLFIKLFVEKIPFYLLCLLSMFVTLSNWSHVIVNLPLIAKIKMIVVTYVFYLFRIFLPINLTGPYGPTTSIPTTSHFIFCLFILVGISAGICAYAKRWRFLLTAWIWFLFSLAPVMALTGRGAIADRYTYVPLVGILILFSWGIPKLISRWQYRSLILSTISIILIFVLGSMSWVQTSYWRDTETFFNRHIELLPKSVTGHIILGGLMRDRGDTQAAFNHYNFAVMSDPRFVLAHQRYALLIDLGLLHLREGNPEKALELWNDANSQYSKSATGHINLGQYYLSQAKFKTALTHFETAIKIEPDNISAINKLATTLIQIRDFNKAINYFERIMELQPKNSVALINIALAYLDSGQPRNAIPYLNRAVSMNPNLLRPRMLLADAFKESGRFQHAAIQYNELLNSNPNNAHLHFNQGIVMGFMNKLETSLFHLNTAAQLEPNRADIRFNLGRARELSGNKSQATDELTEALRLAEEQNLVELVPQIRSVLAKR